ncbi:hypothetical protein Goshw_004721 [Gossypium schwendimanii]|uniref:RNase H type-1 domain-containing protein n=1 Tax=Gossypium schwendimanii TaxID=34291 RepID=A0A7J9KJL3_GOSSC|nr:hypothetical protein [Gossypium schwendimanii]
MIQSDCLDVVKLLQHTLSAALSSTLIRHIQQLLMHVGYKSLQHISREDSQTADCIVKKASKGKEGLQVSDDPLRNISTFNVPCLGTLLIRYARDSSLIASLPNL